MARLDRHVPRYIERLAVRPGITGLTQLRLPPDTDTEGVRRKLVYDLYYVRHVNLWLDTRAMFYTGFQLIHCLLATIFAPLLGLPRWETVSGGTPHPAQDAFPGQPELAASRVVGTSPVADLAVPRPASLAHIPERATIINAFTVDVEDYYQVRAFSQSVDPSQWDNYESRVVANTHQILRLLDEHSARATFFVLGWVADRHPQLVRDIQTAGHELGVHGFWHRCIFDMTPDEFRSDLQQSIDVVENITGEPVKAFRAPNFSITAESLWALDILIEAGISYDSSIFPVYHDTYGIPSAERFPHLIERAGGSLWEFPPSVYPLWKFNLPVAGGGYFRLYPSRLSLQWLDHINETERQPFLFYMHPWELDPDQPRLPGSLRSRFRHYQNLRSTAPKLKRLLSSFRFGTLTESLEQAVGPTSSAARPGLVHVDS
jgi:polysaccharide deacetylase family protein (PEP-CTERM system associated)